MRVEHWKTEKFSKLIIYSQSKADDKEFEKFMNKKLIAIEIPSEVVNYDDEGKPIRESKLI